MLGLDSETLRLGLEIWKFEKQTDSRPSLTLTFKLSNKALTLLALFIALRSEFHGQIGILMFVVLLWTFVRLARLHDSGTNKDETLVGWIIENPTDL